MYKKILIFTKLIYERPRRKHERPASPAIFLKTTNFH